MSKDVMSLSGQLSRGQSHEFLLALEKAGLSPALAQSVIASRDNWLAKEVVKKIVGLVDSPTDSHIVARSIMGRNMFGVYDAVKHYRVDPSVEQIVHLAQVPFSEEVLKSCKDTHVLVAVFPMSILDIRGKVERKLFYSHDDAWYNKQAFAKDKGEVGWQLVRKVPIADSTNKTWNEQQALLSKDEETPKAQVVVYTIIGHFLATGERLFENIYVRTSSVDSDGHHVSVGYFDDRGLNVRAYWDGNQSDRLGLAGSRKSS